MAQVGANEAGVLINDQLQTLRSKDADAATRRAAVLTLLNESGPASQQVMQTLVSELTDNNNASVRRAILQGIRLADGRVSDAFGPIIVRLLDEWDVTWIDDASGALGRIPSDQLSRQLSQVASDKQANATARSAATGALGYHRSQKAARTLVDLLRAESAEALQPTVFRSLARLSGIDQYADDADRWQAWWQQCRSYKAQQWQQHLIENHARRAEINARQKLQMQDRLLLAMRQRYRATPATERQTVLIAMLDDKIAEVRGLALELVRELLIGGEVTPLLTDALLTRLNDASPNVRSVAAYILRDLKNEKAADIAAKRLAAHLETNRTVLRSYLLLIQRLPRANAIDAVLELLDDKDIRGEAAGALIAAIDQQSTPLDPQRMEKAASWLRNQLKQDDDPEPRFVELLGRVGQASDWRFIERWLDSDDPAVSEAAAKVWAKSNQPLDALAKRAKDELIRAVLIPAAQLRGHTAATLNGLIQHPPQQTQLLDAWGQAIVSIAGRVTVDRPNSGQSLTPADLVQSDNMIDKAGISNNLRLQFLSAGVEKLTRIAVSYAGDPLTRMVVGTKTSSPTFAPQLVELLIRRSRVHLIESDPKAALADLARIKQVQIDLTDTKGGQQIELIGVDAHLRLGNIDEAFTRATNHLASGDQPASPIRGAMIDLFLSATDMGIATKQYATATTILTRLRDRLGTSIGLNIETRISVFEAKIKTLQQSSG